MNENNHSDELEVCTGCGDEAFACIIGNGNPRDLYDGPYALCEYAFEEWLRIGDHILDIHD
jgi:hypothetical protein